MENFVQKLINFPGSYIVIALLAFFYIAEHLQSAPVNPGKKFDHLFNNILFYIAVVFTGYLFALLQVMFSRWINLQQWGLLNQVQIPFALKAVAGVICFDFTAYWFHRLSHTFPVLWRLHRVHHSDTNLDASTFLRHHPLEVFVSGASAMLASAIFGLDTVILGIYTFLLIPFMLAQHSNLRLPVWIDKVIGNVFVSPNLHKLHHAQKQVYTDSNFSDILIIWDRLFKTYKQVPADAVEYGLKEFNEEDKQGFWFLIKSPFLKN